MTSSYSEKPQTTEISPSNKISKIKILRVENQANFELEEIQIVLSENFENLKNFLDCENLKNFPNIFVLIIEESLSLQNCDELHEKILKNRPLLVQSGKGENLNFYVRDESRKNLIKVFDEEKRISVLLKNPTRSFISWVVNSGSLLNLELKNDMNFFINAIRARDEFYYRLLSIFELKLNDAKKLFQNIFESRNFKIFLAHLNLFEESKITRELIASKFLLSTTENWQNLFLLAVSCKNCEILKVLMKFHKNISTVEKALDLSIDLGFVEIFSIFESNEEILTINQALISDKKTLLDEVNKLHENILHGNLNEIKVFSKKYQKLRLCYGSNQVCALEHAISTKSFEIFTFLRSQLFYTNKQDELDAKIKKLCYLEKSLIREGNSKYAREIPNNFIVSLHSKIKFDSLSPIESQDVREMLDNLSHFDDIRPLFENAGNSSVKIIFDYATNSVKSMDPTCDEHTMGNVFYKKGLLYVGKNENKLRRWGTFVHELMHFVLYLVYENGCKPYCEDDEERKYEWQRIVEELEDDFDKNPYDMEDIVRWVFSAYDEDVFEAEMAVRIVDMIGTYSENPQKLQEVEEKYKKLFDFHRNFVLPDLKVSHEVLNFLQIKKLNNKFEILSKIEESKLNLKNEKNLLNDENRTIFSSKIPQLTLWKIFDEIKINSVNKLHTKSKNIFIDPEKLDEEKLRNLINASEIERIIFDCSKVESYDFDFLQTLSQKIKIFIVKNHSANIFVPQILNFNHKEVNHTWSELTDTSKEFILSKVVNFQGKDVELSKIFSPNVFSTEKSFNVKILKILCDELIEINFERLEKLEGFVPRSIEKNSKEILSLKDFLVSVKGERINIIADYAGSGKTTILRKIQEIFIDEKVKEENLNFICFISLKDHIKSLSEFSNESFEDFITKTINFNELEAEIFTQKFSKGKVKILFDAFDEISPICKEKTLQIFKLFKNGEKNQIFITTRTHLQDELERSLQTLSQKLKSLEKEDQIQVLINSWKNSKFDEKYIKNSAEKLFEKLSEIIKSINGVIGLPLIVQNLAKIYKNKIDENFEIEIKNLRISEIFRKIVIEGNLQVWKSKFPDKIHEFASNDETIQHVLECLAVKYLIGDEEEILENLNLDFNEDEWTKEEITRGGILNFYDKEKIQFNHETFPEYLVSCFAYKLFKKTPSKNQMKFLLAIFRDQKYQISRIFLDDMLEDFEFKNLKIFASKEKLRNVLNNFARLYEHNIENEGLGNLGRIFFEFIKSSPEFFQSSKEICKRNILDVNLFLIKILPKINNENSFKKLLDEIFEFYSENVFEDFLMTLDYSYVTIFHNFAGNCKNVSNLDAFWKKVLSKNFEEEKIKKLLLATNTLKQNSLYDSVFRKNEIAFPYFLENIYCKIFLIEEIIYTTQKFGFGSISKFPLGFPFIYTAWIGEHFFHVLIKFGSASKIAFTLKLFHRQSGEENFLKILLIVSDWGESFLSFAVKDKNVCLKSLFEVLREILSEINFKKLLKVKKHNEENLLNSAEQNRNYDSFKVTWLIYEEKLSIEELFELFNKKKKQARVFSQWGPNFVYSNQTGQTEILKIIHETKENSKNFLHFIAEHGNEAIINLTLEKLKNNLSAEDFKTFLKIKSEDDSNLLNFASWNENKSATEIFFNLIEFEFSEIELKKFLSEKNDFKIFPLFSAAKFESAKVFSYVISFYEKYFTKLEVKEFLEMKWKRNERDYTNCEYNILDMASFKWNSRCNISKLHQTVENNLEKYEIIMKRTR
jgi:hypothetical protein